MNEEDIKDIKYMVYAILIALGLIWGTLVAKADELIPITITPVTKTIYMPVHLDGNGVSKDVQCVFDTGSSGLWFAPGFAASLGLSTALNSGYQMAHVPDIIIGGRVTWQVPAWEWSVISMYGCCTVGWNLVSRNLTTIDSVHNTILASDTPDYWYQNWNACNATLGQWQSAYAVLNNAYAASLNWIKACKKW